MSRAAVACSALLACFVYAKSWADDLQDPAAAPAATAKSAGSGKLICKREKMTGSNIPRKVCRTQEQIDQEKEHDKEVAHMRNDSTWNGPQPGGAQ